MAATVFLVHPDEPVREQLAMQLESRGLSVRTSATLDDAIELAEGSPVTVVLVEPSLLEAEELEVLTRFCLRAGHTVRIAALAHLVDAGRRKHLDRHEAVLLERPVEDVDALSRQVEALSEDAQRPPRKPEPTPFGKMKIQRLAPVDEGSLEAPTRPDGGAPTVLVVDDEEETRDLFEKVLAGRGYKVHKASSVASALRLLGKQRVDLILSDIMMPVQDGFELKQQVDASVPFIVVSAFLSPERMQLAQQLGIKKLLPKPIQVRELCKAVRGALVGESEATPG